MKSGIAFLSGGKDSVLSMHLAHNQGIKITGIMTMIPEDQESMLYHTHNINLVKTTYSADLFKSFELINISIGLLPKSVIT